MGYPDDLLVQARELAAADPRRPRQSNLRRAVSAAYYALFHEIVDRAVASLLSGSDANGPIGARLRRVIQYRFVLNAAKWFAAPVGQMPAAVQAMRGSSGTISPIDPRLSRVCVLATELQAERHRADYDLTGAFSRAETLRRIADADAAIQSLRSLEAKGDTLIFFLGCTVGDALTKNS